MLTFGLLPVHTGVWRHASVSAGLGSGAPPRVKRLIRWRPSAPWQHSRATRLRMEPA